MHFYHDRGPRVPRAVPGAPLYLYAPGMLPRGTCPKPPRNNHIGLLSPIGLSSRRGRLNIGQRDSAEQPLRRQNVGQNIMPTLDLGFNVQ